MALRNEPIGRKTIAVDFDGVIHSYANGWTGEIPFDPPVPGAIDFVNDLLNMGYEVIILSSRAKTPYGAFGISDYLRHYGVDPNRVRITDQKIGAVMYVDDRGYRFDGDFGRLRTVIRASEEAGFPTWQS